MKKKTSELLEELKDCEQFEKYYHDNETELLSAQLSKSLNDIITKNGLVKSEIIKRSELSEAYVHQIFAGRRHPERDKLICIAKGMDLDLDTIHELFKQCGYAQLYARDKRDSVIIYSITHKLTVAETNGLLTRYGFENLR